MIKNILTAVRFLLPILPFALFALWNMKVNLKKPERSRQIFMPVLALIYCIVLLILMDKITALVESLIRAIPTWIHSLAEWLRTILYGRLTSVASWIDGLSAGLANAIQNANIFYAVFYLANALIMLAHIILKRILTTIMKPICKSGNKLYERAAGLFYEKDPGSGEMFVKNHIGQARTFLKTAYIAALVISCLAVAGVFMIYQKGWLTGAFYPVFGIILIGEICFVMDGLTRSESKIGYEKEETQEGEGIDFRILRPELKRLFGDKLSIDDTLVSGGSERVQSADELLSDYENGDDRMLEAYGIFMHRKAAAGMEIDQSYLASGRDLLEGKSILFNNPFYYDLIPYMFYPMNRALMKHGKVLIVLGRHKTEADIVQWCEDGLTAVTNVPSLWNVGVLKETPQDVDVGVITRSSVHDLKLHEANREFFAEVSFVVLIEPSRLVTTAQVGLNSIVRYCRMHGQQITYCSTDKNCDGLVDALSHILMTNLTEVSATKRHSGISSYMCWTPGETHLQHRMLKGVSRYIGFGTELSFAGVKNGVRFADWYGGDVFPVRDIRWIAQQYYYPLLTYAERNAVQEGIDEYFRTSPNMWSAKVSDDHYMTVEDESHNMFEIRRTFSTRARKQGFINIIASEYLLKDYMADNDCIFDTDPKAIPYIVADYAHTKRNVVMRVCFRMCGGYVTEEELQRELLLIGADTETPVRSLWHELCACYASGEIPVDEEGGELLVVRANGGEQTFSADVIELRRRYSVELGRMENRYSITDKAFGAAVIGGLRSAEYIAEDENGETLYLGTELLGHVFQKYLPGQFFTFDGKYYEMLRVTAQGQVLVRRAADHITGRPSYRQERKYTLSSLRDSDMMGDNRKIGEISIVKQFADLRVQTTGYWELQNYNDFEHGRRVTINGIPDRIYCSKQVLRIDLPDSVTREVQITVADLLNEIFRTLFAENQDYICAVIPGEVEIPLTYSLDIGEEKKCIYIIEDSQLDIGLLEAVRRNLNRILSIMCDYLEWHLEAMENSLHPPVKLPPEFPEDNGEEPEEPKKKRGFFSRIGTFFKKIFGAIGAFFKKIFSAIGNFFKKLFRTRKKNKAEEPGEPDTGSGQSTEAPTSPENGPAEGTEPGETGTTETQNGSESTEDGAESTDTNAVEDGAESADTTAVEDGAESADTSAAENGEQPADGADDAGSDPHVSMRINGRSAGETAPTGTQEEVDLGTDDDTLTFEPESVVKGGTDFTRLPYHERYYLLYGGTEMPKCIDVEGTIEFLQSLGVGNSSLKQARKGKDIASILEGSAPEQTGVRRCCFCGTKLIGSEYERLSDGRERCLNCGKTSIKTQDEFVALFHEVIRNLHLFYGITLDTPMRVEMVNYRKLQRLWKKGGGKNYTEVLGFATKNKKEHLVYMTNGTPRLLAAMIMAHELTHIWQFLHWDYAQLEEKYGKKNMREITEGMAMWSEIQYAYLIGETETAKREEMNTPKMDNEYGRGFTKYLEVYGLSRNGSIYGKKTPFSDPKQPL